MGHQIDGIINLNKPSGKTSFQMVALIRKLSGIQKVGHAGTLDPDATGVLPILIGRTTRLASFLTDTIKVYRAEIQFGSTTTTYDSSGEVTFKGDASHLTRMQIESALKHFHGEIEQVPPMYSAVKHQGKPLYQLAREGLEVDRQPRKVHILSINILEWQNPVLTIEVECGKGTYIRSLANDLGNELGCGAHLAHLIRTRTGPFHLDQSVTPEQVEAGFQSNTWQDFIHPPDTALMSLDAITVDPEGEQDFSHGRSAKSDSVIDMTEGEMRRAYSEDGKFLAIVQYDQLTGMWQPKRVFV